MIYVDRRQRSEPAALRTTVADKARAEIRRLIGSGSKELLAQSRMKLADSSGAVIATRSSGVTAIYTSIPLDLGARYYLGVSTWAPYALGGAGMRWDSLSWRESLPYDRLSSASGLGFGVFGGAGVERALSARSAMYFEGRVSSGTVGVGDATVRTDNIANRKVPVDPGSYTAARIHVGYLRIF